MSHCEVYRVRTRDCDMYGRWKPSALLEAMQEVAIDHCESVGLGRGVTDGLGVVWVLSRIRVELSRQPVFGETVTLETFAMPMRHLFFPRVHVFRDAEGREIGGAQGLWVLMDIHTRRIVANPFVARQLPFEDRPSPADVPATVRPLCDAAEAASLLPGITEFDLNGHVNNARYMDWCWNALGFDALRDREIRRFDVNYDREVLPGESIRTELCRDGDAFSFCGFAENRRCFGISGELRAL